MMRAVYLGLGTNLDNREEWLDKGLARLEEGLVERRAVQSMTFSSIYETEAWGMPEGTPPFLNIVVALETDLPLPALLSLALDVETACGRIRNPQSTGYENRTLDVDVLCTSQDEHWDGPVGEGHDLQVPHPRMMSRRFVLQPLCDLNPTLVVKGQSVKEALSACGDRPAVGLHIGATLPSNSTR
jgi:2-amino-4-hydroxy-6-hydroxymethyldihydropteridine diphosphokinase